MTPHQRDRRTHNAVRMLEQEVALGIDVLWRERLRRHVQPRGVAAGQDDEGLVEGAGEDGDEGVDGPELGVGEVADLLGSDDGGRVFGADAVDQDVVEEVVDHVAVRVYDVALVLAEEVGGAAGSGAR
jgi:hypothetical protein